MELLNEGGLKRRGFVGWLIQKWNLGITSRRANVKKMQLLETLHVGKSQLMLVRCGGEQFLAGGSAEGITTIVKINADEVE